MAKERSSSKILNKELRKPFTSLEHFLITDMPQYEYVSFQSPVLTNTSSNIRYNILGRTWINRYVCFMPSFIRLKERNHHVCLENWMFLSLTSVLIHVRGFSSETTILYTCFVNKHFVLTNTRTLHE